MIATNINFTFNIPTKILFGTGKIHSLHECKMPGKKALIVITSGKSTKRNGYLDTVIEELSKAGCKSIVYDKVASNPTLNDVNEGTAMARKENCDFIVGLGGGSAIDCSKAIAIMCTNPGELWDYMAMGSGKNQPIPENPLPVIAITTTAGTGTEANSAFVITNEETNEKMGLYHPKLFPVISVVDPEMMLTIPPDFTAYQGFDALFHSIEGYICNKPNSFCDMVIETTVANISKYLPVAVNSGSNLEAREHMAFSNTMSGFQMSTGNLTSEHSLEHAMSAYHDNLPHGAGLIMICLAYYTELADVPELRERYIKLAKIMGNEAASEPMDFVNSLKELMIKCGVDQLKMSDYGMTPDEFPQIVQNAKYTMKSKFANEYKDMTDEICIRILQNSYR